MPQYARSFASKGARSEWQECDRHTTHTNCSYISDAFRTRSQRSSPSLALYNCNISIFGVDVAAWIIFHKIVINFLCCKVYAMYFFLFSTSSSSSFFFEIAFFLRQIQLFPWLFIFRYRNGEMFWEVRWKAAQSFVQHSNCSSFLLPHHFGAFIFFSIVCFAFHFLFISI